MPISWATRIIPDRVHSAVLVRILNHLMAEQLNNGELDFLDNKSLLVEVSDAGMNFSFSVNQARIVPVATSRHDVEIRGTALGYLQLISRIEDTDTLFFQRRLSTQGDTELGLHLKNFLDSIEIDSLPYISIGVPMLQRFSSVLEKV